MNRVRIAELSIASHLLPGLKGAPQRLSSTRFRPLRGGLSSARSLFRLQLREDFWFCCALPLLLIAASVTVMA